MTWLLNGNTPAALGIAGLKLAYASLGADFLEFTHLTAAWDAEPLFPYGETLTLTRDGVVVFIGKVRSMPRFLGAAAETMTYRAAGPWDWLQRRILLQSHAVVLDPTVSTVPAAMPQGLIILGQSVAGTSVLLSEALGAVFGGVSDLSLSVGAGFDYPCTWDEVADLTIADALVRLLGTAPDAVSWVDYTATPPTLHIARRAGLDAVTLSVATPGAGAGDFIAGTYSPLESVSVTERADLVPTCVHLIYRRVDTINGGQYLKLETDHAGPGAATDEGALVRTIELAGLNYSSTTLEQKVGVANLSAYLTSGGTVTSMDTDAFLELGKFWKRKVGWLAGEGMVIRSFSGCARTLTEGAEVGVVLNTALGNELMEGALTPWMETSPLNRSEQDQTYHCTVRADYVAGGVTVGRLETLSAGVRATNCASQTYRFTESGSGTLAEPTPTGVAAAVWAALSVTPVEGSCRMVEVECSLGTRPGKVLNLTGGRTGWATMRALVQGVSADIDTGATDITYGPPAQLGPQDMVAILRMNRFKNPALRGQIRATGKL